LKGAGEVRRIGVSERTRDFTDPRSSTLEHPLGCGAARALEDVRVGHPRVAEPSLKGADTRHHLLSDEPDAYGAPAVGEQRTDDLLDALPDVASRRAGL
jgi:hypothetical protein